MYVHLNKVSPVQGSRFPAIPPGSAILSTYNNNVTLAYSVDLYSYRNHKPLWASRATPPPPFVRAESAPIYLYTIFSPRYSRLMVAEQTFSVENKRFLTTHTPPTLVYNIYQGICYTYIYTGKLVLYLVDCI